MAVFPVGNGVSSSIATQATIQKQVELQRAVDVAVLSEALEVQTEFVSELLRSLGVGKNVDVTV
jgi:hypothetical protein